MATPASTTQSAHPLAHLSGTILLAGAGKMESAVLEGWLALGLAPGNLAIVEPAPAGHLTELAARGVRLNPPRDGIGEVAAAVVAVKPQVAPEVMPALAPLIGANTAVVSIMAGRTLRFLEAALPHAALILPHRPTCARRHRPRHHRRGRANARVSREQRALVDTLLSAVGAVEWAPDEALMDAVTACRARGPAYVFLLAEAMAGPACGRAAGRDLAAHLARATVAGAGELARPRPRCPGPSARNMSPRPAAPPPPRSTC